MFKQVQFAGETDLGVLCQGLFGSSGAFEKTAGAPPFADWATGDAIRKYLSTISKDDRKRYSYVLVNALGAGEFYGSNINADFFPWNALTHEGTDYGYKTFEHFGSAFQHHKNKDPSRAFGVPVLSLLNSPMKRVELIIRLDRLKAKEEQADGIITRIEAGEFPDVSMGCKVPFDVCSICGNKSKTRVDYCQHMMPPAELRSVYGPNKILPDGRRIYVINTLPKFFDISFVFIGADKTAKVMAKIASKGDQVCLGDICSISRPQLSTEIAEKVAFKGDDKIPGGKADNVPLSSFDKRSLKAGQKVEQEHVRSKKLALEIASDHLEEDPKYYEKLRTIHKEAEKVASVSDGGCSCGCGTCGDVDALATAFTVKTSEIVKNVPSGEFVQSVLPKLESSEPSLPKETLNDLAQKYPVGEITGGAAVLGIVLKPAEFQRLVLVRMGNDDLADELDDKRHVFRHVPTIDDSVEPHVPVSGSGVLDMLRRFLSVRSGLGRPLTSRVLQIKTAEQLKIPLPTHSPIEDALLDEISAAYNGYRQNLLTKLSQVEAVIQNDSSLRNEIYGMSLSSMFSKTANSSLFSQDSVTYMMSAHITDRNLLFKSKAASAALELMA